MPLTDTAIRAIKNPEKQKKHFDSLGLYLLARANGGRYWKFKYQFEKNAKTLSLGTYPAVSLKDARLARDEARTMKAKGIDPNAEKQARRVAGTDSFEEVAREWHKKFYHTWAETHAVKNIRKLEKDIFPWVIPP